MNMPHHPRLPPCTAALLAVALCATGCASAAVGPSVSQAPPPTIAPPSAAALAAVRTAASRTLPMSASVSLDFAGLSSTPILGHGSFDFSTGAGRARILQPAGIETAVFQPTVVFDHPPAQDAVGLPRGRSWIAAEPSEHISSATTFPQFVLQMEGKDPAFLLAEMSWGTQSVAPLGRHTVGGSSAEGYLAMVDLAVAAASASGPAAAAYAAAIGDEEQALGATAEAAAPQLPIRVWVDAAGLVVQLQASPPGSGVGTTTMTFTSFGAHVDPARPPKNQTVDLASMVSVSDVDND